MSRGRVENKILCGQGWADMRHPPQVEDAFRMQVRDRCLGEGTNMPIYNSI